MLDIQTIIIHDTRRAALLPELLERLRVHAPEDVAWGVGASSVRVCDAGSGIGPWHGMKSALMLGCYAVPGAGGATHVLLLEDDVVAPKLPAPSLLRTISRAVAARPTDCLHFCATRDQAGDEITEAIERGSSWALVDKRPIGGMAVCAPVDLWRRFLRWMPLPGVEYEFLQNFRSGVQQAGDARLWWFLTNVLGVAQVVSVESLVGHGGWRPPDSLAHVMPKPRLAFNPAAAVPAECECDCITPSPRRMVIPGTELDWMKGADISPMLMLNQQEFLTDAGHDETI